MRKNVKECVPSLRLVGGLRQAGYTTSRVSFKTTLTTYPPSAAVHSTQGSRKHTFHRG